MIDIRAHLFNVTHTDMLLFGETCIVRSVEQSRLFSICVFEVAGDVSPATVYTNAFMIS